MGFLKVNKHILKNGLPVFYCHTPDLSSFEISMHINTGSRDETQSNNGVSHFLEHMMFRGSKKHPNSITLSRALEAFGGETNAMTGVEHTTYWLKGDTEKTLEAIECFADFFLCPNFADIDIERSVVLQEITSDYNESDDNIETESLGMSTLFPHHPIGNPIIGTKEIIEKLTEKDLHEKRKHFYSEKNCALSIHTDLSEHEVIQALEKHFGHNWEHSAGANPLRVPVTLSPGENPWSPRQGANLSPYDDTLLPRGDNPSPYENTLLPRGANLLPRGLTAGSIPKSKKLSKNFICLQNNPDNQFALKFMLPTPGGFSRDVIATNFLQRILDDGICTRLPATIREKYGLVYDISCDTQYFHEIGTFSIDAIVSEKLLPELLSKLATELKKIITEKPSDEEIKHIQFRYCFDIKQIKETPSRLMSREIATYFMQQNLSLNEEVEIVKNLTADDIFKTAKIIFSAASRAFVLVGPRARKKRELVELFLNGLDK